MIKNKILMIEDEEKIQNLVKAYLKTEGYEFFCASDGVTGLQMAESLKPDLIILDIMLPGLDGVELLSYLRQTSNVYIIMLTARAEEMDKVNSLSMGADDYMTKPFSPRELVARIKAALRRMNPQNGNADASLFFEDLEINLESRQVLVKGALIQLTTVEFDLLKTLAENKGKVLTREQILDNVWGYDYYGDNRVVDIHIGHIRQKLGNEKWIQTVRGFGYCFSR